MRSETFWIALTTEATTLDVAAYVQNNSEARGERQQVTGQLGPDCHHVFITIPALKIPWERLSGKLADITVSMDHKGCPNMVEVASRMVNFTMVLYADSRMTAGTFESLDLACFAYWNQHRLTLNSDEWVQRSEVGQALRTALTTSNIPFKTEDLGHYFHSEFS